MRALLEQLRKLQRDVLNDALWHGRRRADEPPINRRELGMMPDKTRNLEKRALEGPLPVMSLWRAIRWP